MVTVSDLAVTQFKEIMRSQEMEQAAIRVFIRGQCGCGKVHYGMGFDEAKTDADESFDQAGVQFLMEKEVAESLDGATIDFVETEMSRGFTIDNPNAQGCSCGH